MLIKNIAAGEYTEEGQRLMSGIRAFYATLSLSEAVQYAALSLLPTGRVSSYQRSIGVMALRKASKLALGRMKEFEAAATFESLLAIASDIKQAIKGLGELWAYDFALKMSFHLGRQQFPRFVYLNRRSRKGLERTFPSSVRQKQPVRMRQFPKKWRHLRPYDMEFFLRTVGEVSSGSQ